MTSRSSLPQALRDHPQRIAFIGLIAAAVIAIVIWLVVPGSSDASGSHGGGGGLKPTGISGVVYYDRNDNGKRDKGEPGIPGIRVRDKKGDASTVTDANGAYSFATVPDSPLLQVETGWFRSLCPAMDNPTATSCPPAGQDDRFKVNNQFVQYAINGPAANVDVGLVPDWPGGSMTIPEPGPGGLVPANPVDIAARLSWASGNCKGGQLAICGHGDSFVMDGQVFNQGTEPLTGIVTRLYVPPGDCATDVTLAPYSVPAGLGDITVTPNALTCDVRYVTVKLGGTLPPAAAVRLEISGETLTGPGTPGCVPKPPDKALCPTDEPQSRGWLFGVSHIDQKGDPDSTFCAAGDMTRCPIGLHDKRRSPDEIDPAGHTVDASLGGGMDYQLHAHVEALTGPTGAAVAGGATGAAVQPGGTITLRAWVSNSIPGGAGNASPGDVTVKIYLPAGLRVTSVPPKHNLITCDDGAPTPDASAVVVTCVLGGPVAPDLSSPAIDITAQVPPTFAGSKPLTAVACAAPPATASPLVEKDPGSGLCGLSTDPARTATDDDASYSWTMRP